MMINVFNLTDNRQEKKFLSVFFLLLFFYSHTLFSAIHKKTYFNEHETGWYWYKEKILKKSTRNKKNNPLFPDTLHGDPEAVLKSVQKHLKQLKARAVLDPTHNNIQAYILAQNALSERANLFSHRWKEVLWAKPTLNYQHQFPTNQLANQLHLDAEYQAQDHAIKTLSNTTGLFYFYKKSCPYCQKFSPILKRFAHRYGLSIVPISLDGGALPEFPNSKQDQGQAARFGVTVTPAVFAVNPYTAKAVPLAYGLISEQEMRERILTVINTQKTGKGT